MTERYTVEPYLGGFAVVDAGEWIEGLHDTRASAERHACALNGSR